MINGIKNAIVCATILTGWFGAVIKISELLQITFTFPSQDGVATYGLGETILVFVLIVWIANFIGSSLIFFGLWLKERSGKKWQGDQ